MIMKDKQNYPNHQNYDTLFTNVYFKKACHLYDRKSTCSL